MRIATFNLQNLRFRPDPAPGALQGARDRDMDEDPRLDPEDRRLGAELLTATGADVLALQEVFDAASLDVFHDRWLAPLAGAYPHRLCLPGNDGQGLDVALMARQRWDMARSHADLMPADLGLRLPAGMDPDQPLFRRDCLEARFGALTLFVCHFKAPYPDVALAWELRRMEALAVCHLAARAGKLWLVAGDLNEPPDARPRAIAPLEAIGVDLMARSPEAQRWTYLDPQSGRYGCPDTLIASPALAARCPDAVPHILHGGMGREAARFRGDRLRGVGTHRPHASDHAAIVIDLPRF